MTCFFSNWNEYVFGRIVFLLVSVRKGNDGKKGKMKGKWWGKKKGDGISYKCPPRDGGNCPLIYIYIYIYNVWSSFCKCKIEMNMIVRSVFHLIYVIAERNSIWFTVKRKTVCTMKKKIKKISFRVFDIRSVKVPPWEGEGSVLLLYNLWIYFPFKLELKHDCADSFYFDHFFLFSISNETIISFSLNVS